MIISLAKPVMTNTESSLAPSLTPFFSEQACEAANARPIRCRELFYALLHGGEHSEIYLAAYSFIKQRLAEMEQTYQDKLVDLYRPDDLNELIPLTCKFDEMALTPTALRLFLRQASPIVLTEPYWLQSMSQAATTQTPSAVTMSAVFIELTEGEKCRKAYQALLLAAGLDFPDIAGWTFAKEETTNESSLECALMQTALAHFPRVFFAEILGFTLAYCRCDTQFDWLRTSEHQQYWEHFLSIRRRRLSSVVPRVSKTLADYLSVYGHGFPLLRRRIQLGFWLYRRLLNNWIEDSRKQLGTPVSSAHELAMMLAKKAPAAVGHHGKIIVAGQSLDGRFAESPFDGTQLLVDLKKSRYIDLNNPAASPLLSFFDFNGPMFGVFNESEKKLFRQWLVDEHAAIPNAAIAPDKRKITPFPAIKLTGGQPIAYAKLNNRSLYYYLINSDLYPEVMPAARLKAHQALRSAMLFNKPPFKRYGHQRFEDFVDKLYQHEMRTCRPIDRRPKLSKQAYLWGIEQFAPTILIDGCWLQHIHVLRHAQFRKVGLLLSKIHEDETGNGHLEWNHPFVYQRLLQSVDILLPPVDSKRFIEHRGFIDSAFDLPVYLLSISKFPSTFLPELLGLNLAIELSGLGRIYLRLSDELKYWNIDPTIVDLHISIDNIASGHSALAITAVQVYLDAIAAGSGEEAVNRHWLRIFTGYRSLQSACRIFKFALICRYGMKRLTTRS